MKVRKRSIEFIILLVLPLIFDQITGYYILERGIESKLALSYKAFIYILFFVLTFIYASQKVKLNVLIIIILISIYVLLFTLINGVQIKQLQFIGELFLFPVSYFFFKDYFFKRNGNSVIKFQNELSILFWIIFSAISLSVIGFGASNYAESSSGEKVGYSGYFNAANELSSCLLIIMGFLFFKYKEDGIAANYKFIFAGFILSFLIGSKTLMLGYFILVITSFLIVHFYIKQNRLVNLLKKIVLTLPAIIITFSIILYAISDLLKPLFNRIIYKYNIHDNFISFITSNRSTRIQPAVHNFIENNNILNVFFGAGYERYAIANNALFGYGLIEIDYIDVILVSGIFTFTIILYFWIEIEIRLFKVFIKRLNPMAIFAVVIFSVLLVNAFLAGHILHSSLIAIYLGYTMAFSSIPIKAS